jgi:hypothetical protein
MITAPLNRTHVVALQWSKEPGPGRGAVRPALGNRVPQGFMSVTLEKLA